MNAFFDRFYVTVNEIIERIVGLRIPRITLPRITITNPQHPQTLSNNCFPTILDVSTLEFSNHP